MNEEKNQLVNLVVNEDISSIELMSREIGVDEDTIRNLLGELGKEGRINGYITEDGRRFFKRDIEVSSLPSVHHDESETVPGAYDPRPGQASALIGCIMVAVGYAMLWTMGSLLTMENIASAILIVGLIFLLGGCYWIGLHKTPN